MTIIFSTSYDDATQANCRIAEKIQEKENFKFPLFGINAVREKLHDIIKTPPSRRELIIMSHGSQTSVQDNNKKSALEIKDSKSINSFRIFALACKTSNEIGRHFAIEGTLWCGYNCSVTAPPSTSDYDHIISESLLKIFKISLRINDENSASTALEEIKEICTSLEEQIYQENGHTSTEAFSIFLLCKQLWANLEILLPNSTDPIRHKEGVLPSVF